MPGQNDILENTAEDMEVDKESVAEDTEVEAEDPVDDKEETSAEIKEDDCKCAEQLEKEKAKLVQQLLRLKADFENFRRRSKLEKETLVLEANAKLLQDVLPILDNFERALDSQIASGNGEDPFFLGVKMVYEGLLDALGRHGLEVIEAEGKPFDPVFHEAISVEGEGGENLIVTKQLQTGYLLHDKVLRHTKVLVGTSEEED